MFVIYLRLPLLNNPLSPLKVETVRFYRRESMDSHMLLLHRSTKLFMLDSEFAADSRRKS